MITITLSDPTSMRKWYSRKGHLSFTLVSAVRKKNSQKSTHEEIQDPSRLVLPSYMSACVWRMSPGGCCMSKWIRDLLDVENFFFNFPFLPFLCAFRYHYLIRLWQETREGGREVWPLGWAKSLPRTTIELVGLQNLVSRYQLLQNTNLLASTLLPRPNSHCSFSWICISSFKLPSPSQIVWRIGGRKTIGVH